MEHLNKQQLILLALLISFVTSLATGIVTVSLMDQSPGVTQTISRVVERTIQVASSANTTPGSANVAAAGSGDMQISEAADKISASLVRIRGDNSENVSGIGLVVSDDGIVVTDKETLSKSSSYIGIFSNNSPTALTVIQSQIDGDIVFLAPVNQNADVYKPVSFAPTAKLGQTVWTLSGTSTSILGQGLITQLESKIRTSVPFSKVVSGSPLFNIKGELVGIHTSSLGSSEGAEFIAAGNLQSVVPKHK